MVACQEDTIAKNIIDAPQPQARQPPSQTQGRPQEPPQPEVQEGGPTVA